MSVAAQSSGLEEMFGEQSSLNKSNSDSRHDILVTAANCFRENGYSATSIDDVAHALKATKGMIYHHFRSKADLFFAVYRMGMEINFRATEPHAKGDAPALLKLARMSVAHSIALMREQSFQRVLAQGVALHQQGSTTAAQRETLSELIDIRNSYETLFRKAIEAVAEQHKIKLGDPSIASKSFLAVLNSTVFWYSPREDNQHAEQLAIARELVTYALRGIGADMPEEALTFMEQDNDE
jgi:AcrR family transcriptional regulator